MINIWLRRQKNRLGYKFRKKNTKFSFLYFVLFIAILIYLFAVFDKKIKPMINKMAQNRATYIAVNSINSAINEKLASSNITYNELISLQKNNEGTVTALQSNIIFMNKLKAELALLVQKKIYEINESNIYIPLGNILNNDVLSGKGPKIPITLVPYGTANINFINNFQAAGINQTKHEIQMKITAKIAVLLPTGSTSTEVETNLPIAETIIVGNVPSTYTNVEGTTGGVPDKILNMIGN